MKKLILFLMVLTTLGYSQTFITVPTKTSGDSLGSTEFNQILNAIKDSTRAIKTTHVYTGTLRLGGINYTALMIPSAFDDSVANYLTDSHIPNDITASNYTLLTAVDDSANTRITIALTAAKTITGNWVNTANPWADNEVANDITLDNITQITNRAASNLTGTNWRLFYTNGSGVMTELAIGTAGYVLKSAGPTVAPSWQVDNTGSTGSAYADSVTHDARHVIGDSLITDAEGAARYQPLESTLTDIADGTIAENLVNTTNPWADNEVADNITASNYLLLTAADDSGDARITYALTQAKTISGNWVNTTNPWADNEVADNITASSYLLLTSFDDSLGLGSKVEAYDATLADIADGTIAENLVNTTNPWADNEVADNITASNYLLLTAVDDSGDARINYALTQAKTISGNWVNTASPWADNEVADNITLTNINQITTRPATNLTGGNWKVFYTNGSGSVTELATGTAGYVLKSNGAAAAPSFRQDSVGAGQDSTFYTIYTDSWQAITGNTIDLDDTLKLNKPIIGLSNIDLPLVSSYLVNTHSLGDSLLRVTTAATTYQPLDAQLTDIADGTLTGDFVNTAYPWADNEVADNITASSYTLLTAVDDSANTRITVALAAAKTISGNWVNTTNPWADNEVADDITASNYTLLTAVDDSANTRITIALAAAKTITGDWVNTTNPWAVNEGGTGAATFTDGGIMIGNGTGSLQVLGVATNGQIPIGDGTTDPVLATLTGTADEVDVSNGAGSITIGLVDPLIVGKGGTGVATLTDGGVLIGNAAGNLVATAVLTNGQLLIGDGTTDPTVATLTASKGVVVTNGTGSITLAVDTLKVAQGGSGAATFTDGGILLGSGTGAFTALGVATNGQIPIGDGTTDPVLATISAGPGMTVTNGAGTITLTTKDTLTQSWFVKDTTIVGVLPGWKAPYGITILTVSSYTDANTCTFNLEERDAATPNTAGTDVLSSDQVADNNEQTTSTISNAVIDKTDWLVPTISATGDVSVFSITIWYIKN